MYCIMIPRYQTSRWRQVARPGQTPKRVSSLWVYFNGMRPTEYAQWCFTCWPHPRVPSRLIDFTLSWHCRFLNCFCQLEKKFTNINPPLINNHNRKSHKLLCLYAVVFYDGGLWGKCFLSCRGFTPAILRAATEKHWMKNEKQCQTEEDFRSRF